MRRSKRVASMATIAAAALAALSGTASASVKGSEPAGLGRGAGDAVFVQTDNPAGNQIVAYHRRADGTLTEAGEYATGGLGGILNGSQVDHLASQGSLGYDRRARTLIAVNAGSDTLSVFGALGSTLRLRQVIGSGGAFPVSVAIQHGLVYVLNALGGGSLQGYRLVLGRLIPIPGSSRSLGLDPTATPQFTNTPGQVSFSPDGSQLVVTTKANGNDIDVFAVGRDGSLSASPIVNAEPGTVPFAITFDRAGHLVIAEAGTNALATFTLAADGTVALLDAVGTGQSATCWVTRADGLLFASNAGSASVSGYAVRPTGLLALIGATATDSGTVDSAVSPDGRFLYVQTGADGVVDEFSVGAAGTLNEVSSVTVPGAVGGEGIVTS